MALNDLTRYVKAGHRACAGDAIAILHNAVAYTIHVQKFFGKAFQNIPMNRGPSALQKLCGGHQPGGCVHTNHYSALACSFAQRFPGICSVMQPMLIA